MPAEDDKTVEWLAREYAARVPELEYSPAEILSFLLGRKESPEEVIDTVEVWMAKIMEDRMAENQEKIISSL